jgi:hypothetical protein
MMSSEEALASRTRFAVAWFLVVCGLKSLDARSRRAGLRSPLVLGTR